MKQNLFYRPVLFLLMIMALLALLAAPPPQVHAATITVNSAADNLTASNGLCTLREAIGNANILAGGDTTGGDCVAGSAGADTIIFNTILDGTPITLSIPGVGNDNNATGDLDIRADLTINGNGAAQTIIDGGAIDRVFHLPLATAVAATFNNITVRNGLITSTGSSSNGSGIMTNTGATLTINNSVITNNTLNVTGFTNSGGGIATSGILNINNSTISNNAALGGGNSGGGIAAFSGTTTLVNSTISGNQANGDGGGIHLVVTGSMNLTNVTITNNIADADFPIGLENGGGFEQSGPGTSSTFSNTIIAGNNDMGDNVKDDCHFSSGTFTTNGYNLRPTVINGCSNVLNNVNDITVVTLGLGPLQNNGGPTPTHALLAGSDAIDRIPAAVNGCATTVLADQRGVTRADGIATGTLCDVGAFEYVDPVVPSATNGGDGPGGVGITNGSSSLDLWLDGDEGVYTNAGCSTIAGNGNPVGCWADQSGNNQNATQGTGGIQPTYATNILNGQPVLQFDGGDDVLNLPNGTVPTGNSPYSVFAVVNADVLGARGFLGSGNYGNGGEANAFRFGGGGEVINYWWGNDIITPGGSVSAGTNYALSFVYNTAIGREIWINGTSSTTNGSTARNGGAANNTIGKTVGGEYWDGNIVETILYANALNATERILVENYLSAKYNVMVTSDVYDGDTPGNGNFDLDVAGIGRFGGNNHTQAYSVGMIVRNRSFLQDSGDWLLFGHRTAINSNTTNDLPTTGVWVTAPDPRRWDRHWYVDVTDAAGTIGGTVDIIFDFSEGDMAAQLPSEPVSNYRLLKRTLDTGQFSDIATASAIVGDQVQFLNVNVALLGSNFTLGTLDFADSPTAVTVQNLTANNNSHTMPLILMVGVVLVLLLMSVGILTRRRVGNR